MHGKHLMLHRIRGVRIAALRSAVPTSEIRLEDEAGFYGGNQKKIARMKATLGMDKRRVCPPDVTASDLCAFAAVNLLDGMPETRDKIGALIFVSQSPDWKQPATACELQDRLKLPTGCAAFDVNQGCTGYIYGLWIAASLLASGSSSHVLLLAGDAHGAGRDMRNRVTGPVFGDGGSATLLARGDGEMLFEFGNDGSEFEAIITPAGQARIPFLRDPEANEILALDTVDQAGNPWQMIETYMDGGAIFNFTMEVVPPHIREFMTSAGKDKNDIAYLFLHQANGQIVREVARKAGFPEDKAPADSFSLYGNLAVASIPVAICETFGATPPSGLSLMCGFGIGLSWGSCLCDLSACDCAPVLDFVPDASRPTRNERIQRWLKIFRGEVKRNDPV